MKSEHLGHSFTILEIDMLFNAKTYMIEHESKKGATTHKEPISMEQYFKKIYNITLKYGFV